MQCLYFNSYVITVKKRIGPFIIANLMTGLPYPTEMLEMLIIKDH